MTQGTVPVPPSNSALIQVYKCSECDTLIPSPEAPHPPCDTDPFVELWWDQWDLVVQTLVQYVPNCVQFNFEI